MAWSGISSQLENGLLILLKREYMAKKSLISIWSRCRQIASLVIQLAKSKIQAGLQISLGNLFNKIIRT